MVTPSEALSAVCLKLVKKKHHGRFDNCNSSSTKSNELTSKDVRSHVFDDDEEVINVCIQYMIVLEAIAIFCLFFS